MDTIRVKRANVVVDISPDKKDYYMSKGYSVIDNAGSVIEEAPCTDVHQLQAQVRGLLAENASLKAEIKKLKTSKSKADKE